MTRTTFIPQTLIPERPHIQITRRVRLWSILSTAAMALVLATGAWAFTATLSNFEVDGDIQAGGGDTNSGDPTTVSGVDWSPSGDDSTDETCVGPPNECSALVYEFGGEADQCGDSTTANEVCDNPDEPGEAVFFQDGLKSEGDLTTFGQGDKENDFDAISPVNPGVEATLKSTTPWHIEPGNIPPNKDDLFNTYAYSLVSGSQADVVLAFERTNNLGTSHVDFELNRLPWVPCDFDPDTLCPERAEGDLLISYELSGGGSVTSIQVYMWELPGGIDADGDTNLDCVGFLEPGGNRSAPCPWHQITFDPNKIFSRLNVGGDVPAGAWGSKEPDGTPTDFIPQYGFFETFLDFDALGFGPGCPGFATASLKSRSSDSVTAAIKDLSGPFELALNNCGSITVVKDADPADGTDFEFNPSDNLQLANFYLDDSADSDTGSDYPDSKTFGELAASSVSGNYTVQENTPPTGWTLDSFECVDDDTAAVVASGSGAAQSTATITLQPEQDVTCTFTNQGLGSIRIVKQTDPAGAEGSFSFTGAGPDGALDWTPALTDGNGKTIGNLPAGTYTAIEADPTGSGFDLTDITCEGDVTGGTASTKNVTTRTATFELDPGESLVCTFTNTQRGSLVIRKKTIGGLGTFDFDEDVSDDDKNGASDRSLTTTVEDTWVTTTITDVVPGTYSVTELDPGGDWDLTAIQCTDGDGGSSADLNSKTGTAEVDAGETVTCSFTNTKRGQLVIRKQTVGGTGSFDFDENVSDDNKDGGSDRTLTTTSESTWESTTISNVAPGTYTVTELDPGSSWDLTALQCTDDDSGSSADLNSLTGTAEVDPGETVTCSFTNTKRGSITIDKQTVGALASFNYTATEPDGGTDIPNFSRDTNSSNPTNSSAFDNLLPGKIYNIVETVPAGWVATNLVCNGATNSTVTRDTTNYDDVSITLAAGENISCTFTNQTGVIKVYKQAKNYSQGGLMPQNGVTFTAAATDNPGDSGITGELAGDGDNGMVCLTGLTPGVEYTVTETVPSNYRAQTLTQKHTVVGGTTCDTGGADLTFTNDPLSTLKIQFISQAGDGVTAATQVSCTGPGGYSSGEKGVLDDGETATFADLVEGSYTCTIFVDP